MGISLGSMDTAGRAAVGVAVGGGAALAGTLLTWSEQHPDRAVSVDDAGLRTMLGIAVALIALGAVMVRPTDRRRWWPWPLLIATLGFLGVLVIWIFALIGEDPFSVTTTQDPPLPPDRLAPGLPLFLAGCLTAAVSAVRVRRARARA